MNVLFISECSKNALIQTRKVLDQFAERKGDRSWATAITLEGVRAVHKQLRQSARKNTAVACLWIKQSGDMELLWVVGNVSKFNLTGTTPTNTTEADILRKGSENPHRLWEATALISALAALFHDFGKSNLLFQKKLKNLTKNKKEPWRHEWLSIWLFRNFVVGKTDQEWIQELCHFSLQNEKVFLSKITPDILFENPWQWPLKDNSAIPPIANIVMWLILSHHKLPKYHYKNDGGPGIEDLLSEGINDLYFFWNSPQASEDWKKKDQLDFCKLKGTLPLNSDYWRKKASIIASLCLKCHELFLDETVKQLNGRFNKHIARLGLMLADHYYSSLKAKGQTDQNYLIWANTNRTDKSLNQKLDEHLVGTAFTAYRLIRQLSNLSQFLPSIEYSPSLKRRASDKRFQWQDKAFDLCKRLAESSSHRGFFGVNLASTGTGKTIANTRAMYALSSSTKKFRLSIALGLRTLTLQTGDAIKEKIHLDDNDVAVVIGSKATQLLHEEIKEQKTQTSQYSGESNEEIGSESSEEIFDNNLTVKYEGQKDLGGFSDWLRENDNALKFLSAPLLVCTIDQLIVATESLQGGHQILPMLRLLTSDLVLDEPDDFGIEDLPALSRLVNWCGMLGGRIMLSSATLPPALVAGLFEAYQEGRKQFNTFFSEITKEEYVDCAWFDEFGCTMHKITDTSQFVQKHQIYIDNRIKNLAKSPKRALRKGAIISISAQKEDTYYSYARLILEKSIELHNAHHQIHSQLEKTLSVGVVRFANIRALTAVATELLKVQVPENIRIHLCVYHSQFLLAVRSKIEYELDTLLKRHNENSIWEYWAVKKAMEQSETHHIFIVLGTPVLEVGRDHDYDWAIIEPSSMRSIIQLVGRVQRHRQKLPLSPNVYIFDKNIKSLLGKALPFSRPGFETKDLHLVEQSVSKVVLQNTIETITADDRITERQCLDPTHYLADLEHAQMQLTFFNILNNKSGDNKKPANAWWKASFHPIDWSGEMQRLTPFRKSEPMELYTYYPEDSKIGEFLMHQIDPHFGAFNRANFFSKEQLIFNPKMEFWLDLDAEKILWELAERFDKDIQEISFIFGSINLRANLRAKNEKIFWSYELGYYDKGS